MTSVRKRRAKKRAKVNSTKPAAKRKFKRLHFCGAVGRAYDKRKTLRQNFNSMGLSLDPNVTLPCRPRAEKESDVQEKANVEVAGIENAKSEVVTELENEAAQITRLERHIAPGEVQFLTNLLLKYGNDYKRMVRDKSNYYQHTYKQLKRKCEAFLLSKQGEQAMRQLEQQQM